MEAQRASEPGPEQGITAWALVELIEAAARTGKTLVAHEALERLVRAASAGATDLGVGCPYALAGVAQRGRCGGGLLSRGDRMVESHRAASRARPCALGLRRGLRRENRRLDVREQLRVAHDLFTTIGMEAFAERAQTELHATGEHVRAHTVETWDDLTAQERQFAELAGDGLSNPEIGVRLFLSPRNVEWHLRHVFAKPGLHSRRECTTSSPEPRP